MIFNDTEKQSIITKLNNTLSTNEINQYFNLCSQYTITINDFNVNDEDGTKGWKTTYLQKFNNNQSDYDSFFNLYDKIKDVETFIYLNFGKIGLSGFSMDGLLNDGLDYLNTHHTITPNQLTIYNKMVEMIGIWNDLKVLIKDEGEKRNHILYDLTHTIETCNKVVNYNLIREFCYYNNVL